MAVAVRYFTLRKQVPLQHGQTVRFTPKKGYYAFPPSAHPTPPPSARDEIVKWARWGAEHEPAIHYTQSPSRDDWLKAQPGALPLATDCSGFVTLCYRWAGQPDPNGLGYRMLGYTGTLLDHAANVGRIITDVSLALPGDPIVVGPGTGDHVVICIEAGPDPLVVSHGWEGGPVIQHLSVDRRVPRRVCRTLAP